MKRRNAHLLAAASNLLLFAAVKITEKAKICAFPTGYMETFVFYDLLYEKK